jgi:4-hydroxythreonine-4-phosphate dehydrogenase
LALTVGDPAGIGPEIVLRALGAPEKPPVPIKIYGSRAVLHERAQRFGLVLPGSDVEWHDIPLTAPIALGQCSASAGESAKQAVCAAAEDAMAGRIDALVTAPLNKESLHLAGHTWPGHTELLADQAGCGDFAMMFVGGALRVVLLTIHRSLRSVPDAITNEEILRVARLLHRELPAFGAEQRRIALCGLNPHAGEGGLFGDEEERVMRPAVQQARREGLALSGPLPADSLFTRALRGEFDAVIAAYHDQGLIPVKLLAFGQSVNVTIGLPFVRTSVDHGTGFDIVEKGQADASSLIAAMKLAARLASFRLRQSRQAASQSR